jgi:Nif11 domain
VTSASTQTQRGGPRGIKLALAFIAAVRRDPALRQSVATRGSTEGLGAVLAIAAKAGFPIEVEDLRTAFSMDWGLRRALYLRDDGGDADRATTTVAAVQTPPSPTKRMIGSAEVDGSSTEGLGTRIRADGSQEPSAS